MTQRTLIPTVILLLTACFSTISQATITPYYSIRSQGLNTPRHLAGIVQQMFVNHDDCILSTFSGAFAYNSTFKNDTITECLFGCSGCPTITIAGSQIADRECGDWLADYFYLPTDFKSSLSFNPHIDNFILDLNYYIDLNQWCDGLYLAFFAPIVHTRWDLGLCESVDLKGTNTLHPGYFTPDTVARNDLLQNFTEYASGCVAGPISQTVGGDDYTITFSPLRRAKMSTDRLNKTSATDLRVILGYDICNTDRFQFGFQGIISAPAGTRPKGRYLFEPIVGNGHHWEVGGALQTSWQALCSQDEQKQAIFLANLSLLHLFAARQTRTFDLKNRPFSRYALLERMLTPIRNNLKGDGTTPSTQFRNEFQPVANFSTLSVDVAATMQVELTAMMTFVCNNFSWDIGYNFWDRTCEKLKLREISAFENNTKWALKGDSYVFGFDRGAAGAGPLEGAVALSATQNDATICSGNNFTSDRTFEEAILNPGIDNPENATGDASGGVSDNPLSADPNDALLTIQTSVEPQFVRAIDIDVCEQRTRGRSSKFFTHVSYTWNNDCSWVPYLGIGGEVEFGHNSDDCTDCCDTCISCALSQWGVWLKGGMTF